MLLVRGLDVWGRNRANKHLPQRGDDCLFFSIEYAKVYLISNLYYLHCISRVWIINFPGGVGLQQV